MYKRKQGRRRERASHERNIKLISLCSLLQLHGRWHSGSTPAHSRTVLFFSRLSGVELATNTVKNTLKSMPAAAPEANLATAHDWRETGGGNEPVGVCSQRDAADRCLLLGVACFQSRDLKLGGQDLLIQGLDAWTRTLTFLVRGHQSRSSSMLLKENRRRSR